ncbi:MAG: DUF4097 family beta strand repeat protein [Acidobacteria bacterium]|nr:DUF4097 family beta strand repeat protein [Acidobacteriota bacterium]
MYKKAVLVLIGVAFLLSGCGELSTKEVATLKEKKEFKAPKGYTLQLKNKRGKANITGWSKDTIEVAYKVVSKASTYAKADAEVSKIDVEFSEEDGKLKIFVDYPPQSGLIHMERSYVEFRIQVPYDCKIEVDSSSMDAIVEDIDATVKIDASSGDLRVENVKGVINLETSSGDITILESKGDVRAYTSSGDIYARDLESKEMNLRTSSGDQKIFSSSAFSLVSKSSSGDIIFTGDLKGENSSALKSSSGDVILKLDPSFTGELHTWTSSGDVRVGFENEKIKESRREYRYLIGDAKKKIEIKTSSGDIILKPGRD